MAFSRTPARYLHTLRNLPEMVRNMDHIVNRFDEAATYGYLHAPMAARLGVALNVSGHGLVSQPSRVRVTMPSSVGIRQVWLAAYLIKVNAGLAAWGRRCLPTHQLAYLATMDLVRCASESCNAFAAQGLAQLLRPRMLHVAPRAWPTNHTHAHAWRMPMHGTRMQPSWRATARSPGRLHAWPPPGALVGYTHGTLSRRLAAQRTRAWADDEPRTTQSALVAPP